MIALPMRGLMHRLGLAIVLFAAFACRSTEQVLVDDLPPDARMVLVSVDSKLRALAVAWWQGAGTSLEAPADGAVVGFVLEPGELVDDDGAAISTESIGLRLHSDPPLRSESCGRCFSRAAEAPQTMSAGESCPPPLFAEARRLYGRVELAGLDGIREAVRLDAPGRCPCNVDARPTSPMTRDLELAPLAPELAAWPVEVTTTHADGRVGLFGEHVAIVTSSSGAQLHELEGPSVFGGSVMAAAPDVEGGFLLFVHEPTAGPNEQLRVRLGPDLVERERSSSPIRAITATWLEAIGAHLIAGDVQGAGSESDLLWLCPPGLVASCVELQTADLDSRGTATQLIEGPGGLVLAELFYRHLLVFERIPEPNAIEAVSALGADHGRVVVREGPSPRFRILPHPSQLSEHTVSFLAHGNTLYACARLDSTGVFALRLDDAFYAGESNSGWARAEGVGDKACVGILTQSDEVQIAFADGSSVLCSTTAPGVCRSGPPSPIAADQTATLSSTSQGFELAFAPNHVRQRSIEETEWHVLYGVPPETSPVYALAASPETMLVARRDGTLERYRLGLSRPIERDGAWSPLPAMPIDAVFVPRRDAFIVSVVCDSATSAPLWRVPLDGNAPTPLSFAGRACQSIDHLADLGPAGILLIDRLDEIHRLDQRDDLHAVSIEWDDPETADVESTPELLDWRALSAVNGIAVAVGHGPAVARIDGRHEPDRAYALSLGRATQTIWNPLQPMGEPEPQALAARCADDWRVASRGRQRANFEVGVVWRLAPDPDAAAAPGLSPSLVLDEPSNASARGSVNNPSGIRPRAMVGGDADWTVLFMDDSLHRVGASWRLRYIGARTADVVELPDDRFVLGTNLGDLFLGTRLTTE